MGANTMNSDNLHALLLLATAFLAVFAQMTFDGFRWLCDTQLDLLPALMVYAALTFGPGLIAVLAVLGGLWFDSLSANPPGISVIPLLAVGAVVYANRQVILRQETFAQFVLGLCASAVAPALSLVLLLTFGQSPLLGWVLLWQLAVMALGGAALTPLLFKLLDGLHRALSYPTALPASFREHREIKRGRL